MDGRIDVGTIADMTSPGMDAQTEIAPAADMGAHAADTGAPAADTGAPAADTGTPLVDMGAPPVDTGTGATDTAPALGLVAAWALDQPPPAGSTSLVDAFGNTILLRGPVTWSDDRPPGVEQGRSLAFTGGNSFADVTLVPSRRPASTGAKTVALWFKSTDPGTATRTLIALFNQSMQADVGLQLGIGATKIEGWPFGRSFRYLSFVTPTPRGWHHVAYTFAAGTHVMYVDGVEVHRSTTWEVKSGTLDVMKLGTWNETAEPGFYVGLMRDLRIYSQVLGPQEIRALAGAN